MKSCYITFPEEREQMSINPSWGGSGDMGMTVSKSGAVNPCVDVLAYRRHVDGHF